jgi:hypothetical protein
MRACGLSAVVERWAQAVRRERERESERAKERERERERERESLQNYNNRLL